MRRRTKTPARRPKDRSPEMQRFRRRMTVIVWASFVLPVVAGSAVAALLMP